MASARKWFPLAPRPISSRPEVSSAALAALPTFDVYRVSSELSLLLLRSSETPVLYLSGHAHLTLVKGRCEVFGYQLPLMKRTPVTCCPWNPAYPLTLSTQTKAKGVLGNLKQCLKPEDFALMEKKVLSYDAIVLIESHRENDMEWLLQMERFSSTYNDVIAAPPSTTHTLHSHLQMINLQSCLLFTESSDCQLEKLEYPTNWKESVSIVSNALATHPKVLICGSKGVGKSTFLRYLLNSTLHRCKNIAVLDCDLGQPEFTVSGIVSLHILSTKDIALQPIHLNLKRPHTSYFIGDIASKHQPHVVLQAVRQLLSIYQALLKDSQGDDDIETSTNSSHHPVQNSFALLERDRNNDGFPLFVNLDGWTKGMGEDILSALIPIVGPSHVIHLRSLKNSDLEPLSNLPQSCVAVELEPGRITPSKVHGVDMRNLRFSYVFSN